MQFVIRGGQQFVRNGVLGVEVEFAQLRGEGVGAVHQIDDGDLVEVEIEGGLIITMTGEELRSSDWFELRRVRDGEMELVPTVDRARGMLDGWLKKLTALFVRGSADRVRDLAIGVVEKRLCPSPGFYQLHADLGRTEARSVKGTDDVPLILLHGTFSSILGSFGAWLSNPREQERLWQRYRRIYALEHRTLEETPIANAIAVLDRLDKDSSVDLVGYSRGGLIGELLAQRALDDKEIRAVIEQLKRDDVEHDQLGLRDLIVSQYQEFHSKLRSKKIHVRRFVRVGCPARGTRLASRERLRNVLALVRYGAAGLQKLLSGVPSPVLQSVTQGLSALTDLTQGVVLDVINPHVLPGLYSMDPRRHFIRHLINHEKLGSDAELANVGANTLRSGLNLGKVADFVIDLYFNRANDWVVDTESMIGGAQRANVVEHLVGSERMHTQYFADPAFAQTITDGLVTPKFADLTRSRYRTGRVEISELREVRAGGNTLGPVLIVLPGIMGSQLVRGKNKLWLDVPSYVGGGFKQLRIDQTEVEANGFVGDVYDKFCEAFRDTHEVIPFPYDWRHSVVDAGKRLNAELAKLLKRIDIGKRPIQIVAHSMGGLVVRGMLSEPESMWPKALVNPDSRIIMLGTPNQGSHAITEILSGQEGLMQKLAMADLTEPQSHHVGLVARFPGILDMLPVATGDDGRDYFESAQWDGALQPLGKEWPRPAADALAAARARRARLIAPDLVANRVHYIAGQAPETPCALGLRKGRPSMAMSKRGDGRVLWDTGIPAGVPFWFAPRVRHGNLPGEEIVQKACAEILSSGDTSKLKRAEPEPMKSGWFSWLRDGEALSGAISEAEFEALALGMDMANDNLAVAESALSRMDVQVAWGHLKDADFPLFVGHYEGDGIFGAERSVDEYYGKRLSDVHRSGLYPGAIGSHRVFYERSEAGEVQTAVVVGLGEIGSLNATMLQRTVCDAVIGFAIRNAERRALQRSGSAPLAARGLSFLLIGSTAGSLSVREVGRSILQGVLDARKAMKDEPYDLTELRTLQFIELFEDVAHTLWYQLDELAQAQDPLADMYLLDPKLHHKREGKRRLRTDDRGAWWQPLKIERRGDTLLFTNLASRAARAEVSTVEIDRIVGELINVQVRRSRRRTEAEQALFELLVPREIKDMAPESGDLRLLVTPGAAAYPWEMLSDRLQARRQGLPLAVRIGMVRQLSTLQYRHRPLLAGNHRALVIIDPKSTLSELPGAQAEGEHVGDVLESCGWKVNRSRRDQPGEIIIKHFGDGHEIVHYCGHGVDDVRRYPQGFEKPVEVSDPENAISGMVLGNGVFLTAKLLENLRELPRLAFVNCCHLGAIQDKPHQIAAHFAEKLIMMGVPCVIAAGWAVDDRIANVFAEAFYQAFLGGENFGDSVKRARNAAYVSDPGSNTFAAYQCYGDPSFSLQRPGTPQSLQRKAPSAAAFITEVLPFARSVEQLHAMAGQLDAASHLQTPAAFEALAEAFERRGALAEAVGFYEKAIQRSDHQQAAQLKAFTPWVNLGSRVILDDYRKSTKRFDETKAEADRPNQQAALAKIDTLIATVNQLLAIDLLRTSERYGLLGATLRRKALLDPANARVALADALVAYVESERRLDRNADLNARIAAAIRIAFTARALDFVSKGRGKAAAGEHLTNALNALADAEREMQRRRGVSDWDNFLAGQIEIVQVYAGQRTQWKAGKDLPRELVRSSHRAHRRAIVEQIDFMLAFLPAKGKAIAKLLSEMQAMLTGVV